MKETSKCERVRQRRGDFAKYLHGHGIDVGCGNDLLRVPDGSVRAWDLDAGDAQLMAGVPADTFDFVYSSHCLEHLRDVPEALRNWARIVRPGGWLYVVVPDYVLYEKMTWPSRFNSDHKQSFSGLIERRAVVRPNHWHMDGDLASVLSSLGLGSYRWELESRGFNFNAGNLDQTRQDAVAQLYFVAQKPAAT